MLGVSSSFLNAIASGASLVAKAELLHPDLTLDRVLTATEIKVVVRDNIIRRTAALAVVNDGTLTPDPAGVLYFDRPIRTWMGVRLGNSVEWAPTFTGYFDEPEDVTIGPAGELTLPCRDRFRIAADSTFGAPLTLGGDTRVQDAIRLLLTDAGFGSDDALYALNDGGRTLGTAWTWEVDRNRLDAAAVLANDFALELFCSPLGVATLAPWQDPNLAAAVQTYRRGADVMMLGFRKKWIDSLKNRAIVVGDAGNGAPIRVELRDLNPLSPGYNPPPGDPDYPGPLGDRPDRYASAGITSEDVAYAVAQKRLAERALVEEQIQAEVPVNPALELHDVIEVIDNRTKTSGKWILDGFTVDHAPSTSLLPARRVRPLTA